MDPGSRDRSPASVAQASADSAEVIGIELVEALDDVDDPSTVGAERLPRLEPFDRDERVGRHQPPVLGAHPLEGADAPHRTGPATGMPGRRRDVHEVGLRREPATDGQIGHGQHVGVREALVEVGLATWVDRHDLRLRSTMGSGHDPNGRFGPI